MIDPDDQHLLDEARLEEHKCPGFGRSFALWAGIRARETGQPDTANPFDMTDEADLFAAWARGHTIQRQTQIPVAPVVSLHPTTLPRITPTHAAKTHACMDD